MAMVNTTHMVAANGYYDGHKYHDMGVDNDCRPYINVQAADRHEVYEHDIMENIVGAENKAEEPAAELKILQAKMGVHTC